MPTNSGIKSMHIYFTGEQHVQIVYDTAPEDPKKQEKIMVQNLHYESGKNGPGREASAKDRLDVSWISHSIHFTTGKEGINEY